MNTYFLAQKEGAHREHGANMGSRGFMGCGTNWSIVTPIAGQPLFKSSVADLDAKGREYLTMKTCCHPCVVDCLTILIGNPLVSDAYDNGDQLVSHS